MILCPECHADTRVTETRDVVTGAYSRRRRQCNRCGHRVTTVEFIVATDLRLTDIALIPMRDLIEIKRRVASWTDAPMMPAAVADLEDAPLP